MKGRKAIPTQLNRLRGNPGKRRLNDAEPKPAILTKVPSPPSYLDARAKYEWNRVGKELLALGLLASVDRSVLAGYCIACSQVAEATVRLRKEGLTLIEIFTDEDGNETHRREYSHPLLRVRDNGLKAMRAFAVEFGISPSSRSRLKIEKPKEKDKFAEFLNQGVVPALEKVD